MAVPKTYWNQFPPVIRRGNTYECFTSGEEDPLMPGVDQPHVVGFQYRFWDNRNPAPAFQDVPAQYISLWWDDSNYPICESFVTQSNLQNNRTFTLEVRAVDNLGQVDPNPLSYTFTTPIPDHEPRVTAAKP